MPLAGPEHIPRFAPLRFGLHSPMHAAYMWPLVRRAFHSLSDELTRGHVPAQVFPNNVSKPVITTSALYLSEVRPLGVHIGKQHAESAKHVLNIVDHLHVFHVCLLLIQRSALSLRST